MRLNRGTLILIVVSLIVIIAAIALTLNQAAAPDEEQRLNTTATAAGPVFEGVDTASLVRFEVRDNRTGERTVIFKTDDSEWGMGGDEGQEGDEQTGTTDGATAVPVDTTSTAGELDQAAVDSSLASFTSLEAVDSFEADELAQFGLDTPAYTIYTVNDNGAVYAMHIGDLNPNGTRYYAVVRQLAAGETSPDVVMEPVLERIEIETSQDDVALQGEATDESGEPVPVGEQTPQVGTEEPADSATEEAAEALTPNPTLEAMAATLQAMGDSPEATELVATYRAAIMATNEAFGEEAGATAEPAQTEESATPEAEATDMEGDLARIEIETSLEQTPSVTGEATAEVSPAPQAGDVSSEVTVEPVAAFSVELEGPETVYVIPASTLDSLLRLITDPPVVEATEMPMEPGLPTLPAEVNPEERPEDEGAVDEEDASEDEPDAEAAATDEASADTAEEAAEATAEATAES